MTDRKQALIELRDRVKAGTLQDEPYGGMPMLTQFHEGLREISIPGFRDGVAMNAYKGSLDAAKALHEAVLPGWYWTLYGSMADLERKDGSETATAKCPKIPARAWLLSILEALIAQEGEA